MTYPNFAEMRAGLTSPTASQRLSLLVFLGRNTDPFPITTITQLHQNAEVLIDQDVTIESFTVTPGVNFVEAPVVAISNWNTADILLTPSGCTIDGSAVSITIPAKGELVLVALTTGDFLIQGSQGGSGGSGVAAWGGISGTLADQLDLSAVLDEKAGTSGATFTGLTTFLGGMRVPNGTPVSGPLTALQHSGGEYFTAGNCTVPDEAGFKVLLFVTGSHTIGLAGGSAESFLNNDVVRIAVPQIGVVLRHKSQRVDANTNYNQWKVFSSAAFTSFDSRVASLSPTSYWKLQGTGTATTGGPNAVLTGSPTSAPTIVRHDDIADGAPSNGTCIAMPGTSGTHVSISHDYRFHVPGGTFVIFHQHNTGNITGSNKSVLLCRDEFEAVGGFSLEIMPGGSHRLYFRRPGGQPLMNLQSSTGAVSVNQAYATIAKWGFTDTLFVEDSFTGAAAPLVGGGAHVGELGATWTKQTGDTGTAEVDGTGLVAGIAGGDGISSYFASGIPPTTNYAAEAIILAQSGGDASVCVRMATTTEYYRLGFSPTTGANGSWLLRRKNTGVGAVTLATSALSAARGSTNQRHYLRLEATGTNPVILRGWVNGRLLFSYTDAVAERLTAAGKAGIWFGSGATSDKISHFRAGVEQTSGWSIATYSSEATLVRRTSSAITEAPTQESDIRIGAFNPVSASSNHKGPMARVIFFNRRIADSEEPLIALPKTIVHP